MPLTPDDIERFQNINAAFRAGDLIALRAALGEPEALDTASMPMGIGNLLVYAIYHSPLPFLRTLLDAGVDPRPPVDDGFPPLIAALSCRRAAAGSTPGRDVPGMLRLLLDAGADPDQRGINDWTALHMAVAERDADAIGWLLASGADPRLRTRIDDYDTAGEMAAALGLDSLAERLGHPAPPKPQKRSRNGGRFEDWLAGDGETAVRGATVELRYTLRLKHGEIVQAGQRCRFQVGRREVVAGLDQGVEGMRTGGVRHLEIGPHLGYGERGVAGKIPPGAVLEFIVWLLAV